MELRCYGNLARNENTFKSLSKPPIAIAKTPSTRRSESVGYSNSSPGTRWRGRVRQAASTTSPHPSISHTGRDTTSCTTQEVQPTLTQLYPALKKKNASVKARSGHGSRSILDTASELLCDAPPKKQFVGTHALSTINPPPLNALHLSSLPRGSFAATRSTSRATSPATVRPFAVPREEETRACSGSWPQAREEREVRQGVTTGVRHVRENTHTHTHMEERQRERQADRETDRDKKRG